MLCISLTLCTHVSLISSFLIMVDKSDVILKTPMSSEYHLGKTRDNQQIHPSEDRRMTKMCRTPRAGMVGDNLPHIYVPL